AGRAHGTPRTGSVPARTTPGVMPGSRGPGSAPGRRSTGCRDEPLHAPFAALRGCTVRPAPPRSSREPTARPFLPRPPGSCCSPPGRPVLLPDGPDPTLAHRMFSNLSAGALGLSLDHTTAIEL